VAGGEHGAILPGPMRPHHAAPHQTVQEARDAVGEHVGAFFDRVASWHRWETAKPPAEHSALVVGVGVGKSKAGREALAAFMTAARGSIPHRILWLVQTHKLGNEALTAMEMLGLSVAVMRGREAKVPISGPPDPEDGLEPLPMCLNLPAVADALLIHVDVEKDVCGTGQFGEPSCPFHYACEYQRQKAAVARADIVIAAHQALFHRLPKAATEGVGLVVVDESWWQVGLLSGREVRLAGFSEEPLLHPVLDRDDFRGTSPSRSWGRREADEATNDLHVLSGKAQAAFEATPHGAMVGKEAVVVAGLTTRDCADAVKLEWRRKVDGAIVPGMTAEARKKAVEKAAGNTSIPRRVGVWKALEALLAGDATHTGRLELSTRGGADGAGRAVLLHSRMDAIESIADLPILALDATMPVDVVRHYLPRITVLANVQPHVPHMTVTQVIGGWGKTSLVPSDRAAAEENRRRRELVTELADFARLHSAGNGLVITYKDIEKCFAHPEVRTGHFNAIAGLDTFADVRDPYLLSDGSFRHPVNC
jgi:hypothetical protein